MIALVLTVRAFGVAAFIAANVVFVQWLPLIVASGGDLSAVLAGAERGVVVQVYIVMMLTAVVLAVVVLSVVPTAGTGSGVAHGSPRTSAALALVAGMLFSIAAATIPLWFASVSLNPSASTYSLGEIELWEQLHHPAATASNCIGIASLVGAMLIGIASSWTAPRARTVRSSAPGEP